MTRRKSTQIDPAIETIVQSISEGKELMTLRKGASLYSPGDPADAIYLVQTGRLKVTVPSQGKNTVVALIGPGELFGKVSLFGQSFRITTATAIESSTVFRVRRQSMLSGLDAHPDISERALAALVSHNIDMEEDICARLFKPMEKRLARALLKLSSYGQHDFLPSRRLAQLSHQSLAVVSRTTPARVSRALDKFRRLGFLSYNPGGEIVVNSEMLTDLVLATRPPVKEISPVPFETVRTKERVWKETTVPGISLCSLFEDAADGHGAILVKMAAGARYPDHQHMGREQFYVIEGDVKVGKDTLYAGDYHRAEGYTYHRRVSTGHGCMCVIFGYVGSISAEAAPRKADRTVGAICDQKCPS